MGQQKVRLILLCKLANAVAYMLLMQIQEAELFQKDHITLVEILSTATNS